MLIGLPSNGLHTNGYTEARRLFFEQAKYTHGPIRQRAEGQGRRHIDARASQLSVADTQAHPGRGRQRGFAHMSPAAASRKTCRAFCPKACLARMVELSSWEPPPVFHPPC